MTTYEKGDKVETIHGEMLTVIKTEKLGEKRKKGVVVEEGQTRILAESGGVPTWFPMSKIK